MPDKRIKKKISNFQWWDDQHRKILVVDDEVNTTDILKALLEEQDYDVQVAYDGKQGWDMVKSFKPDLILSDVSMPQMNGFDLCQKVKDAEDTRLIPIILITGLSGTKDKIKGIDAGADDFINKPFNSQELSVRVRSLLKMKGLTSRLENIDQIILAFSRAVEARDPYTRGHSERVGKYAMRFAEGLGLSKRNQQLLFKGAILHDIGKIGIADGVLLKKGKLTDGEYAEIKKHPEIGTTICAPLKSSRSLLNIVAYHHERMDGTGYPYGLMAEEIPIEARIIAITDTFDALTSARPYRQALSLKETCEILNDGKEHHFDEDLLPIFVKIVNDGRLEDILEDANTERAPLETSKEIPKELIQELDFFDRNFII